MSKMETIMAEEARLIILRALDEQPDNRLNSSILQQVVENFGISKSRDWIHVQLDAMKDLGAIAISYAGTVRIANLTPRGQDHVHRLDVIDGIKRPSAIGT